MSGNGDGAKDKKISGGPGQDVCKIDDDDKAAVRGCEKVRTVGRPSGGGGSGGSGGSGGPGGGGGSGSGPLTVVSSEGLSCAGNPFPPCVFQITGTGADTLIGTVTGGGGVTVAAGAAVAVQGDEWTATGIYGCAGDGFLRVTIGPESIDVPVTCTTP